MQEALSPVTARKGLHSPLRNVHTFVVFFSGAAFRVSPPSTSTIARYYIQVWVDVKLTMAVTDDEFDEYWISEKRQEKSESLYVPCDNSEL